ncbi:MAG: hypothetical protein U0V56_11230 [Actinomycetota bacterium]
MKTKIVAAASAGAMCDRVVTQHLHARASEVDRSLFLHALEPEELR